MLDECSVGELGSIWGIVTSNEKWEVIPLHGTGREYGVESKQVVLTPDLGLCSDWNQLNKEETNSSCTYYVYHMSKF